MADAIARADHRAATLKYVETSRAHLDAARDVVLAKPADKAALRTVRDAIRRDLKLTWWAGIARRA